MADSKILVQEFTQLLNKGVYSGTNPSKLLIQPEYVIKFNPALVAIPGHPNRFFVKYRWFVIDEAQNFEKWKVYQHLIDPGSYRTWKRRWHYLRRQRYRMWPTILNDILTKESEPNEWESDEQWTRTNEDRVLHLLISVMALEEWASKKKEGKEF